MSINSYLDKRLLSFEKQFESLHDGELKLSSNQNSLYDTKIATIIKYSPLWIFILCILLLYFLSPKFVMDDDKKYGKVVNISYLKLIIYSILISVIISSIGHFILFYTRNSL